MLKEQERIKEEQSIANDIIEYVRRRLLMNLRYLNRAIYALPHKHSENVLGIGTDGQFLYYGSYYAIKLFRYDKNRLNRDYLHTLLHCVFRHFEVGKGINHQVWNLSCDIAVENLIQELNLPDMKIQEDAKQMEYISLLAGKINLLSAEKIYHFFMEEDGTETDIFAQLTRPDNEKRHGFSRDDHSFWYPAESADGKKKRETESIEAKIFEDLDVTDPDEIRILPKVELTDKWKKIADIINVDLETESKNKGVHAGSLAWQIQVANRDRVDYKAFLKKFAHFREIMGTNQDEFDYVYYTYGLEIYRDLPLIEPLEYKEDRRIQEFVIAIDTSGSISQSRIQRFLESIVSILKSQETFYHKMKIFILQCDAQIQHVAVIESMNQLEEYLSELTVYGYGGTDFRPVFEYVEQLQEEGQIQKLEGLLYFTDGLGIYPTRPTSYKTAFIFTEANMELQDDFPNWAMKLVLTEDEIDSL